jgi:hypothetical protein
MGEETFVFLDDYQRPYMVTRWGESLWLFYWGDDHWVSLRETSEDEAARLPKNMPTDHQELYHEKHKEWEKRNY